MGDNRDRDSNRDPSPVTEQDLIRLFKETVPLTSEERLKFIKIIQDAFSYQRRMHLESKEEAIKALLKAKMDEVIELRQKILDRKTTLGNVAAHYEKQIAELQRKQKFESKTGLLNYDGFREKLSLFLIDHRESRSVFGVVDISDFKLINDTYGHSIGDLVLEQVSELLKEHVRSADFITRERRREQRPEDVGDINDIHARFGGDEFVFFSPDINNCGAARIIAERFVVSLRQYDWSQVSEQLAGVEINVDVGVVCLRPSPLSERKGFVEKLMKDLLTMADVEMYRAKRRTKSRAGDNDPTLRVSLVAVEFKGGKLIEVSQ